MADHSADLIARLSEARLVRTPNLLTEHLAALRSADALNWSPLMQIWTKRLQAAVGDPPATGQCDLRRARGTDLFPVSARFDDTNDGRILKWHEALDTGVDEEACLPTELVDRDPDHSSRPTTARLQIGEVFLTASMSDVFLRLGDPVLVGDSALSKSDTESMLVEFRRSSTPSERQPAVPVESARQEGEIELSLYSR